MCAALLAGYEATRPLPPAPETLLTTLTHLRHIQNLVWDIGLHGALYGRDHRQQIVATELDGLRAFLTG